MSSKILLVFIIVACLTFVVRSEECDTPDLTDFCSEVVSDAPNRTVDKSINGYIGEVEKALSWLWDAWTNRLSVVASRENFTVCEDCVTALKHAFCSSLAPTCGFVECYDNSTSEIESMCIYSKNSNQESQCASACVNALNSSLQETYCYLCEVNCIASIIEQNCGQYMMSRDMCAALVSVCTCSTADVNEVCQFFSESGYTIPYEDGLSCASSSGWCSLSSKRDVTSQAGLMVVNNYVAFTIPNSVGQESIADPLISSGAGDTDELSTDSAASLSFAFLLSIVVMIVAI